MIFYEKLFYLDLFIHYEINNNKLLKGKFEINVFYPKKMIKTGNRDVPSSVCLEFSNLNEIFLLKIDLEKKEEEIN